MHEPIGAYNMRRADKEIKDAEIIQSIMNDAIVCRLAMAEDNVPYIVPMHFAYEDSALYFHCADEGKKLAIISRNPVVCFEVDTGVEVIRGENACSWGTRYCSIIGQGRAEIIDGSGEKRKALDMIMRKYSGRDNWDYSGESMAKIRVIKVSVEHFSAKSSGLRPGESAET